MLPSALVTLVAQVVSLALVAAAVLVLGSPVPSIGSLVWGGVGGLGAAVALTTLYYAFAHGPAAVVAPVSAVAAASLPVVVGFVTGERPSALAVGGIILAVVAVGLISSGATTTGLAVPRVILGVAVLAGFAGGVMFIGLHQADHDSGLWPLLSARVVSVALLTGFCLAIRTRPGPGRGLLWLAALIGILDVVANALYLEAVRNGMLSIVAVISSLYPASTVALAFVIDRERPTRRRIVGFVVAIVALGIITWARS
ncbi:EamA family transporter [Microbacterium sp. SORGH_AS_0888]|uniref:EamA family transporter n=1 Tax=Microbacterium sp. SORGH_AS_0888 TaxID=3041791 RepID=UPI0027D7B5CE|nr:EamA family transporter [Microbacterium sp. SORGH_AS_0888]